MNTLRTLLAVFVFCAIFTGCKDKSEQPENLVVLVKYKTLPNKSVDAVSALKLLIEEVEKEKHFIKLKLHVDPTDNSNILLYEEWEDEQYYRNQHMQTDHLKKFIADSQTFLAGAPEVTFWKINAVYK